MQSADHFLRSDPNQRSGQGGSRRSQPFATLSVFTWPSHNYDGGAATELLDDPLDELLDEPLEPAPPVVLPALNWLRQAARSSRCRVCFAAFN
jgi:hypothetical protein